MKRFVPFCFALGLLASAFGACTMDFDQFQPGGGAGGSGGTGGACATECCAPSDCPAPADPCMQATCSGGTCGEEARPDGTEAGMQTPGDCQKIVCQGGATESVDDNMDTPGAANDCVTGVCDGGSPMSENVNPGMACASNGGAVCDGEGNCVGCLDDSHCTPDLPNCDTGPHVCVGADCMDGNQNGAETDTDCGGPVCAPCGPGDDCVAGTDCESGACGADMTCELAQPGTPCQGDSECQSDQCAQGVCCMTACFADCMSCNVAGMAGTCVDVPSGSDPGNDCDGTETCDGKGACAEIVGESCSADMDCLSGFCEQGVCCTTACTDNCHSCALTGSEGTCTDVPNGQDPGNDCTGAEVCDGAGMCIKGPNGAMCGAGAECTSTFCMDGVCCNEACPNSDKCKACDVANLVGTCSFVPAGMDLDGECMGGTPNCDGAGMCE
jgi:hypothetical protein